MKQVTICSQPQNSPQITFQENTWLEFYLLELLRSPHAPKERTSIVSIINSYKGRNISYYIKGRINFYKSYKTEAMIKCTSQW